MQEKNKTDLYDEYEDWKGWNKFFEFTKYEARYFCGETRGMSLKGRHVLELGFGSGSFLAWAAKQGASVYGTKIGKLSLAAAREHDIELLEPAIETIAQDHEKKFDLVVAFDLFEHFPLTDFYARLNAIETMLKPGGMVILRFPNGQSPLGLFSQNGDITHITALSIKKMEQIIQGTAFEMVHADGVYRVKWRYHVKYFISNFRYLLRDIVAYLFFKGFYRLPPPYDPVVAVILQKRAMGKG